MQPSDIQRAPFDHPDELVSEVRERFGTDGLKYHHPDAVRLALSKVGDVSGLDWIERERAWRRALHAASMEADPEYAVAYRREQQRYRRARLEASGLLLTGAQDLDRLARADFERTDVIDRVDDWIDELRAGGPETVLYLFGPVDAGKTFAAGWAIAGSGWRRPIAVRPNDLARAFRPDRFGDGPLVERVHGAGLLVIDDLGTEAVPWFTGVLLDVLEARMGDRATVITGNVNPNRFAERYGERLASRAALWRQVYCPRLGMRGELPGLRSVG